MKGWAIAVCLIFLAVLTAPALATNTDKYGYITIEAVDITLDGGKATINVEYTLDEPTRVIVLLLGKQDLKNRLLTVLNYEDAEVKNLDLNSAELVVDDVSYAYGRGVYWFPSHTFNVLIPTLRITTPQVSREYAEVDEIPNGIGYFDI
ncbi:MAG: hypothetical protein LUQ12_00050 [Methanoregulaceae archaeon]|nr:hypothetical protein [Methanoregulaceae archaeon]